MPLQFATFASNQFELFSSCMAIASLQKSKREDVEIMLLVPEEVISSVEARYPHFKIRKITNQMNVNLKVGFKSGFNPRNSFRAALKNIAKKASLAHSELVYFAPTTIFHTSVEHYFSGTQIKIARAPDEYWPNLELYGPRLHDIWQAIAKFGEIELDDWVNDTHPINYWRRYPLVSSRFIYLPDPEAQAIRYEQISKDLIDAEIAELSGQDRDLVEASLAIFAMKEKADLLDINWDNDVSAFESFTQLCLRMSKPQYEAFQNDILETPMFRQTFKQIPRLRAFFYLSKLRNISEGFDSVQAQFSMMRTDKLIERREINKQMTKLTREINKKIKENQDISD